MHYIKNTDIFLYFKQQLEAPALEWRLKFGWRDVVFAQSYAYWSDGDHKKHLNHLGERTLDKESGILETAPGVPLICWITLGKSQYLSISSVKMRENRTLLKLR